MSEGGALRQIAAIFGIQFDDTALKKGRLSIDAAVTALKGLGVALAGSAIVRGVADFASEFEHTASRLDDVSQRLGISTDALQEFQHAARLGGVQADELNQALTIYERNSGHALTPERFEQLADSIQQIHDPAQRVQRAVALFGRAGAGMVPVLADGAAGVRRLRQEFHDLGGGIDQEGIRAGAEFGDALDRWNVASEALKTRLAVELIPALTRLVEWVTRGVGTIVRFMRGTETLRIALIALGVVLGLIAVKMLLAFAPVIAPVLIATAAITALVVLIEDFVGFMQGRDSLIGRAIEKLFGKGAKIDVMNAIRDLWHSVVAWVGQAWSAVVRFWTAFGPKARTALMDTIQLLMTMWGIASSIGTAIYNVFSQVAAVIQTVATKINEVTNGAAGRFIQSALSHVNLGQLALNAVPGVGALSSTAGLVGSLTGSSIQRNVTQTNTFHIDGTGHPDVVANRVMERINQANRAQHDADHPLAPQD